MEYVKEINAVVNRFIWGRGMLAVFLFVGVMFTVRTGFSSYKGADLARENNRGRCFGTGVCAGPKRNILSLSFSLFVRRLQQHLEPGISQVWQQH